MDFLYLSEEDMVNAGVKNMTKCMDSIEDMFKLLYIGDYRMGGVNNSDHGLRVMFPKQSDIPNMPLTAPGRWFTTMPAYLGGKHHVFGIKSYGANQDNFKKNLPRSILMMSLMDVDTGAPIAYMSANVLSAMRTGAVSGLAAKYFADKKAKKVAIIGPGVMARYSLDAVMIARPKIEEIAVYGRGERSKERFKRYCEEKGYKFRKYEESLSIKDACSGADIIITANTQAERFEDYPLIKENYIKNGACIIVVSAVRIERTFMTQTDGKCTFIADDIRMYAENRGIDAKPESEEAKKTITVKGAIHECILDDRNVLNFPEIVQNGNFIRNEDSTYIFASGGIPLEDVAWADECYQSAKKINIGTRLKLWDESLL